MITIPYTTENENIIINEQLSKGLKLIEYQNLFDGDFLVFSNLDEWINLNVRPIRDQILDKTDKLMLRDIVDKCTLQELIQIKQWRQALRDITTTITTFQTIWPTKPTVDDPTVQGLLDKINY